jgi:hypothetical protein
MLGESKSNFKLMVIFYILLEGLPNLNITRKLWMPTFQYKQNHIKMLFEAFKSSYSNLFVMCATYKLFLNMNWINQDLYFII